MPPKGRPPISEDEQNLRGAAGKRRPRAKKVVDGNADPLATAPDDQVDDSQPEDLEDEPQAPSAPEPVDLSIYDPGDVFGDDLTAKSAYWIKVVMLHERKLMTIMDVANILSYAFDYARMLEAQIDIRKRGQVYEISSKHGARWAKNPSVAIAESAGKAVRAFHERYGGSLASRGTIGQKYFSQGQQLDLFGQDTARPMNASAPHSKGEDEDGASGSEEDREARRLLDEPFQGRA